MVSLLQVVIKSGNSIQFNNAIFAHKQKQKRMSQFHKVLNQSFTARFLRILVKMRAFNIKGEYCENGRGVTYIS